MWCKGNKHRDAVMTHSTCMHHMFAVTPRKMYLHWFTLAALLASQLFLGGGRGSFARHLTKEVAHFLALLLATKVSAELHTGTKGRQA